MAKTPEEMAAAMVAKLPEKTGKPLGEWLRIVADSGLGKHGQIVKHLKAEHGMTHGYASLVAHQSLRESTDPAATQGDALIDQQYTDAKAALRPIYDRLVREIRRFGDDIDISPRKTYVSLRRNQQFGLIQASTRTRVDVGLKLADVPAGERLEASGSFNSMVSHRVRTTSVDEVDDELIGWLREAYEQA